MDQDVATTIHKGRVVTVSTKWWMDYSNISYAELYCIHALKLTEYCETCKQRVTENV